MITKLFNHSFLFLKVFKLRNKFNMIDQDIDYKYLERVLKDRRIVYDINDPVVYRRNWLS